MQGCGSTSSEGLQGGDVGAAGTHGDSNLSLSWQPEPWEEPAGPFYCPFPGVSAGRAPRPPAGRLGSEELV